LHDDVLGLERLPNDFDGEMGLGPAAHEDIQRRIPVFRPAMNADVRLSKHGNAGNAPIGGKVMHVDMQEGRSRHVDTFPEGILDVLKVVKARAFHHVDDQMRPGKDLAVTLDQVVFSVLLLRRNRAAKGMLFFRLGGA
jgi:hypothetical protein